SEFQSTTRLAFGADFGCGQFGSGAGDSIACVGDNTHGQLGNNGGGVSSNSVFVGTGLTGVSITAGPDAEYACAAADAGDVRCWGFNDHGQLGVPLSTQQADVPTKVFPSTTCTSVAAGTDGADHDAGRADHRRYRR